MVRDLMNLTGPVSYWDGPYNNPNLRSSTHVTRLRKRGDLTKTLPVGGIYCVPTSYYGVDFMCGNSAFDYTYRSYGALRRSFGTSASGMFSPSNTYHLTGVGSDWLPSLAATAALASLCDSRVRNKIVSEDWSLGQSLVELPETLRFIISTAERVLKAYQAVRSGNASAIYRTLLDLSGSTARLTKDGRRAKRLIRKYLRDKSHRDVASLWLEVSFAWRPLVQDVYSACQVIANGLAEGDGFIATSRAEEALNPPIRDGTTVVLQEKFEGKRGVLVSVSYRPTSSYLWDLQKLGLTNPASLAWELYPMSFLIDWFIPVGNFLEGLQQPFGVTFQSGYRTTYVKWRHEASFHNHPNTSGWQGEMRQLRGSMFSFRRDIYVGFPVPVPAFRGFGNLSAGQKITIAALIRQFT